MRGLLHADLFSCPQRSRPGARRKGHESPGVRRICRRFDNGVILAASIKVIQLFSSVVQLAGVPRQIDRGVVKKLAFGRAAG
jgi:hypothetical protein